MCSSSSLYPHLSSSLLYSESPLPTVPTPSSFPSFPSPNVPCIVFYSTLFPPLQLLPGGQKGLKWMEALTTLFSTSVIDILIALLQKLSDVVLPVWGQRQPLTVSQANVLVLIATFALRIAQTVLSELLSNGDHQYRDTRIIGTLLSLHMVLCSASHSTIISNAAPDVSAPYPLLFLMFVSSRRKRECLHEEPKPWPPSHSSCFTLCLVCVDPVSDSRHFGDVHKARVGDTGG